MAGSEADTEGRYSGLLQDQQAGGETGATRIKVKHVRVLDPVWNYEEKEREV